MACNCGIVVVGSPNTPTIENCQGGCLFAKSMIVPCGQGPQACNDVLEVNLVDYVVKGNEVGDITFSAYGSEIVGSPNTTTRPFSSFNVSPAGLLTMTSDMSRSPGNRAVRLKYKVQQDSGILSNIGYIDVCLEDPCLNKDTNTCDPCTGAVTPSPGNLSISDGGRSASPKGSTLTIS